MPKTAVISYHKNITSLYPSAWIDQYRRSILNQTNTDFDIFELNYGGGQERIFPSAYFISYPYPTFVHAMNYLLDLLFKNPAYNYDCVFNTNADDYYAIDRVEKQLIYIEQGYDIVSSNFFLVKQDIITENTQLHNLNLRGELNNQHNIIGHPSVVYSKNFWKTNRYNDQEIPREDLKLWQRSIMKNRFIILPDYLLFHRVYNSSVSAVGFEKQ